MKRKNILSLILACIISSSLIGCDLKNSPTDKDNNNSNSFETDDSNLKFDDSKYTSETMTVDGKDVTYRAYKQIVYVEKPVDTKYQCMNIYVPEAYFNGESVGIYNVDTAPVFFPNGIGGYLPAEPLEPSMTGGIGGEASRAGATTDDSTSADSPNAVLIALSKGFVVASPGARGRSTQNENGKYTGKAPAAIVDLKAAVRYLRYNDDIMPGNYDRIIANGTSAGGALSALLGATGNSSDYDSYLNDLGAANAKDDIYAVSSYCPITNLNNADMAYEWMFNGINNYTSMVITEADGKINREKVEGTLTEDQIKYSDELKKAFIPYVNSLNLKDENGNALTLDENGNGTFKDCVTKYIIKSAQAELNEGKDLSSYTWLTISNNVVTNVDFNGYIAYLSRSKVAPAFDAIDLSHPENILFGTDTINAEHFTKFSFDIDGSQSSMADDKIIKMMNPMNYIGTNESSVAKYWRIRHGAKDSDTALPIPMILALTLDSNDADVDFLVPWSQGHGGDYDIGELMDWIEGII